MTEYLTREQVAEQLGIAVTSVRNLVARGILPEQRSAIGRGRGGRRSYYLPSDVLKLKKKTIFPDEPKPKK